jgi:hypothetical protein
MPELQKLCRESSAVLLMEMVSLDALGVAMLPSPPPFETCESPVFVDREGLLASDILIRLYLEKKLCDLIINLEAVSLGYGMKIACVLAGKTQMT